eukprot:scaffold5232_cov104-Skeletonema_marinoi.AAC.2
METTLRAFITLFKDSSNHWVEEDYPRGTTTDVDGSFIPTGSLVYKMYKRVVFHTDETSSEMTFDCSSFSEYDYYDSEEEDFGGEDNGVIADGGVFREDEELATEVLTTLLPSVSAHDSSLSSSSPPSSSSMGALHLLSCDTYQDLETFPDTDERLLLQELSDRASSLLQRESCSDYTIQNYFQRLPGCCPRFPPSDQVTEEASAVFSSDSSSLSTPSGSTLPIDSKCRSIMMNWSFRVVEFSLLNHDGRHRQQLKARLLSRAFSYVDRICTKFEVANRDQYKLLTIVCLHLAAKISGLLKSDAHVYDCYERFQRRCSDDTASTSASSRSSSSPSTSSAEMSVESSETIVPTPHSQGSVADSSLPLQEEEQQDQSEQSYSTEYIWLLSLHGLHSLCNDEFTMDEFKQMECTILQHGLDWRVSSVVALDWVDIYLELMVLRPPPLLLRCNDEENDNSSSSTYGKKNFLSFTKAECDDIRDKTLTQSEYALKQPCFMTCAPSLLGLAAFLNVMKGYCSIGRSDCDLLLLSSIEGAIGFSIDYDDLYDMQVKMMFKHDDDDDECLV